MTADGVVLNLHPAGLASRVLAGLLDGVILYTLISMVVFGLATGGRLLGPVAIGISSAVASGGMVLAYAIVQESLWNGKTLGKAALGLRVVTEQGGPIGFRAAAVRGALLLVDIIAVPFGALWCIGIIATGRRRRLGDLAAGTIVVAERSGERALLAPMLFVAPQPLWPVVEQLDVGGLDGAGYRLIRRVLLRHPKLSPATRRSLLERTADVVAQRLDHAPPRWPVGPWAGWPLSAEHYLVCVASAYQLRHQPGAR